MLFLGYHDNFYWYFKTAVHLLWIVLLGLGLLGMSLILDLLTAFFLGRNSAGIWCPNKSNAFLDISTVELFGCFNPSMRTSWAIFFILPCIFLNPYAAAFFVVIVQLPYRISFKIYRPSSCIQDKLKAARRLLDAWVECNCSCSFPRSSTEALSFSRPVVFLFPDSIKIPLNISANASFLL